jgi:hypothetical protein
MEHCDRVDQEERHQSTNSESKTRSTLQSARLPNCFFFFLNFRKSIFVTFDLRTLDIVINVNKRRQLSLRQSFCHKGI